jgi:hypothetical protein
LSQLLVETGEAGSREREEAIDSLGTSCRSKFGRRKRKVLAVNGFEDNGSRCLPGKAMALVRPLRDDHSLTAIALII